MGIKSVILEYHRDIAILRFQIVDDRSVNGDGSCGDVFQTREHTQGRGFAASRRTDENDELVFLHRKV